MLTEVRPASLALARKAGDFWVDCVTACLTRDRLFLCVILAYFSLTALTAGAFGMSWSATPWPVISIFVLTLTVLSGVGLAWTAARRRSSGLASGLRETARAWRLGERLRAATIPGILMSAFFVCFSTMKGHIPRLNAFADDPWLAALDVRLHGAPAWTLLQPVLGWPWITALLALAYLGWFAAFYISLASMMLWIERPILRSQFLVAFVLTWSLLGLVAATAFSSVGPVFYGDFYHADPFAGLKSYLASANHRVPILSVGVQQLLLDQARRTEPALGTAISAMPSVHVATATLLACLACRISRAMGVAGLLFLATIFVASVHLGYHYAVDGYAAMAGAAAIWWISGRLAHAAFRGAHAMDTRDADAQAPWPASWRPPAA